MELSESFVEIESAWVELSAFITVRVGSGHKNFGSCRFLQSEAMINIAE